MKEQKTEKVNAHHKETRSQKLNRWEAKTLQPAVRRDGVYILLILFFVLLALWSGNKLARHMTPSGIMNISEVLDWLEMPRQLPDAPIRDEHGQIGTLWGLADQSKNLLSFYAPWCGPCQKELPELVKLLRDKKRPVVIVSKEEKQAEVRKQLDNLGLKDLPFFMDFTGAIINKGKVKSLPTTFLTTRKGKVLDRVVGYSTFKLYMLTNKVNRDYED